VAIMGLRASFAHHDNGMTEKDMLACVAAADELDEVIIFRSTGPWARRWIERDYPTKNFHVKGKSSDWGPQAGFVPYLGIYSKEGSNLVQARDGTALNDDGLGGGYAGKTQLTLALDELILQASKPEGSSQRKAIEEMVWDPDRNAYLLRARRSGDSRMFTFLAQSAGGVYKIFAMPEREDSLIAGHAEIPNYSRPGNSGPRLSRTIRDFPHAGTVTMHEMPAPIPLGTDRRRPALVPLEVMTSSEVGADNRPMTGDYDLMAVCPRWESYGSTAPSEISKPGLVFEGKPPQPGQTFDPGARMDKVLDMRVNTGARPAGGNTKVTFQNKNAKQIQNLEEHPDMGNLTPRILRCINVLNERMGQAGALRRVHHNAESHRNQIFGALTAGKMSKGDGLPLTVFQPRRLLGNSPTRGYENVSTLETLDEFRTYASLLQRAGYFVPRHWAWGMSIRDQQNQAR
jgi:hypothetical protein